MISDENASEGNHGGTLAVPVLDNVAIGSETMPVGEPSSVDRTSEYSDTETRGSESDDESEDSMDSDSDEETDEEQPPVRTAKKKRQAKVRVLGHKY